MAFSDKQIHFLCRQKKAPVLDVVIKWAKDVVAKDTQAPEGKLEGKWVEKLKSSCLQLNDITYGLAHLFVVKETNELRNVKKRHILWLLVLSFLVCLPQPKRQKRTNIVEEVTIHCAYFRKKQDCIGRLGISPLLKCASAVRQLTYDTVPDALDEHFGTSVVDIFGPEFL
ncbi:hypothetical protein Tco_0994338 [Tanacetum coccineum]